MNKTFLTWSMMSILCLSAMGQTKNFIDQPYIEVTGSFDTMVTPNLIYIKIVISEKDTKDKISLEEQENKMVSAFKNLGINTETDLTTSDMMSNYKFYFLKQKDIFKTKEYVLKVTTAQTATKVFIKLEELGISNTSIYKVEHSDIDNLKNVCRIKAIENSQKLALELAKALSHTIGNAIYISENESNFDNPNQNVQLLRFSPNSIGRNDEPPKIEFEKIEIRAKIYVKYILK